MASADARCTPPVLLIRISTFLGDSARVAAFSTSPTPSTSAPPPQKPDPRDANPKSNLVSVQAHKPRELIPHPVEAQHGGRRRARGGHGGGERAGPAARAREEGGMVRGRPGRGGDGCAWEGRGEERGRDAEERRRREEDGCGDIYWNSDVRVE